MDEAEAADSPSRQKEASLAIGCLVLLSLQQLHEGYLYLFTRKTLGLNGLQDAWMILLVLFVGLAVGLWTRSRAAWGLTVGLIGMIAVLHLAQSLPVLRLGIRPVRPGPPDEVCGLRPTVEPFTLYWLIAKNALLAGAPSLLLLGRLRQSLAR